MDTQQTDYLLVKAMPPARGLELWVDWESEIDGDGQGAIIATRQGDRLLVSIANQPNLPVRDLGEFEADEWTGMKKGLSWVMCISSGVLSRRQVSWSKTPEPSRMRP